jgi:hypothetical protein
MLVASDDLVLRDFRKAFLGWNSLHVANGLTRWLVDHAKRNRILCRNGGVKLYGDQDEAQAKVA